MNMKTILLQIFLYAAISCNCQILFTGYIKSESSGKPIENAQVSVIGNLEHENILLSDGNGFFTITFQNKCLGKSFRLRIVHSRYTSKDFTEVVINTLQPKTYNLLSKKLSQGIKPSPTVEKHRIKNTEQSIPKETTNDGFFEKEDSARLIFKGNIIKFIKVAGNSTDYSALIIKPYYISEPLTKKYLVLAANEIGIRGFLPKKTDKDSIIDRLFLEDAIAITKMLNVELPSALEIINADMADKISLKMQKELYYDVENRNLGEIEINPKRANTYLSNRHSLTIIPNNLETQPQGNFRIVVHSHFKSK